MVVTAENANMKGYLRQNILYWQAPSFGYLNNMGGRVGNEGLRIKYLT